MMLPSDDHCEGFNYKGKPFCWVSQPYQVDLPAMEAAAEEHGLRFHVDDTAGWYWPGSCTFVTWWRKDAPWSPVEPLPAAEAAPKA